MIGNQLSPVYCNDKPRSLRLDRIFVGMDSNLSPSLIRAGQAGGHPIIVPVELEAIGETAMEGVFLVFYNPQEDQADIFI